MKLNSARVVAIWDGEVLTTWREAFLNVKGSITQLKGIVSHDEGELHANYTKCCNLRINLWKRTP